MDNPKDVHMFFFVAEQLVQGRTPEIAVQAIVLGRLTALRKFQGGVCGIVVGNVVRRLTSKTVAQQLGKVKLANMPCRQELVASASRTHYRC